MFLTNFFENPSSVSEKERRVIESSRDIKVAGGTARLYEIAPAPEDIKDSTPFFWAPGFGGTKDTYANGLKFLAEKYGLRVATIDHPRFGKNKHIPLDTVSDGLEKTASNVLGAIKAIQKEYPGPINAGAHSRGALDLITAAAEQPERFDKIILIAPAGLIGKDTIRDLAQRFFESSDKHKEGQHVFEKNAVRGKNISESALKNGIVYVLKNIMRSLDEATGISNSDIRSKLETLKEHGVKVTIIASIGDLVFPLDRISEVLGPLVKNGVIEGFFAIKTLEGHSVYKDENCFDAIGYALGMPKKNRHKSDGEELLRDNRQAESLPASSAGVGE